MRLRPSGRKAALRPTAAGAGEQLTVHDVRLIASVLELPVRRLPYPASCGAALVFDGPEYRRSRHNAAIHRCHKRPEDGAEAS